MYLWDSLNCKKKELFFSKDIILSLKECLTMHSYSDLDIWQAESFLKKKINKREWIEFDNNQLWDLL